MSAVADQKRVASPKVVLHDIDWPGFQALLGVVGDRSVRVAYDRGVLEIMTPLPIHERYKVLIGRIIEMMADELGLDYFSFGSTTFQSEDLQRAIEPDACFHIASAGKIKDWRRFDPETDPPPDLAVEIDVTSDSRRRLGIYAALKIPEVWRFDGEELSVLLLQNGEYVASASSPTFPRAPLDALAAFARDDQGGSDRAWAAAFRRWVREVVLPGED